ncbi:MAG: gas vesicle protein GvpN [Lentisphaerae bacterium]|nr:gas vesicle protein GvpN [Lentisphaerota bacterium]
MTNDTPTAIEPAPNAGFVQTPKVRRTVNRALRYIRAGYPVHFRGPAGTGKTTLALHVAACLKRPVALIHGDEEFTTSDLVGGEHGYHFRKVVDNFISRVKKTEEDMTKRWVDNRLTVACKLGFTLVYDEYTRSPPEANNILLSILQDRIMDIPLGDGDQDPYLKVHPDFTAVFTSNPEEYAGVHRSQDALRDRMITIDLDHYDHDTEAAIVHAKSKLPKHDCETIVRIMRQLRDSGKCEYEPTIRSALMIAKTLKVEALTIARSNGFFREICQDIFSSQTSRVGSKTNQNVVKEHVGLLIETALSSGIGAPAKEPANSRTARARGEELS